MNKGDTVILPMITIIATMLASVPAVSVSEAHAQNLTAGLRSANQVHISTERGTYPCSDGTRPEFVGLDLHGYEIDVNVRGHWETSGEATNKSGEITGGTITSERCDLRGTEQVDSLCNGKVPKEVTISGKCTKESEDVDARFEIIDGSKHTFRFGEANCHQAR